MKASFQLLRHYVEADLSLARRSDELSEFRKSALSQHLFSKLLTEKSPQADSRALDKFLLTNAKMRDWTLSKSSLLDDHLVGELCNILHRFWNPGGNPLITHFGEIISRGGVGPGSSLGAEGLDYYSKLFSSRLTTTSPHLYTLYRRYFSTSSFHSLAEKARYSDYGDAEIVNASKLFFVPKRNDISRTICVEPSLNMYFQIGIRRILEDRLLSFFSIDLSSQPSKNRELALVGSRDGLLTTLDLSSASDSIGTSMLRRILPKDWLGFLLCTRSPRVQLPTGEVVDLHMISSMGNAFTFPLETILFRSILEACRIVDGSSIKSEDLAVFGDDLIYPTVLHRKVTRLLELLGFTINSSKTFFEGPFRESCGHDYYNGHDVRPVFIKSLDTQQDRFVAINLLNAWSAKFKIPLNLSVSYLLRTVEHLRVPPFESLDSGILTPYSLLAKPRLSKIGVFSYTCKVSRSVKIRLGAPATRLHHLKRFKLSYNPFGLLESFLRGNMRNSTISVRLNRVEYARRRRITPYWDYSPLEAPLSLIMRGKWSQYNRDWILYCAINEG